ncbi:IS110 family transposase [Gemmatimonadota bacterium]
MEYRLMTLCDFHDTRRETMTHMAQHLGEQDIIAGMDLASAEHVVVLLTSKGERLTRFTIPHSLEGLEELVRRTNARLWNRPRGRVVFAFEATGHVWEAVAHFLEEAGLKYRIVNPLATHRVREARQLDRDKRDVTDAEQIAELLRTGIVTETQLDPPAYVELRRLWREFDRIRRERARFKTLIKHQLFGLFPELVGVWKDILGPGAMSVLRLGLTPRRIAEMTCREFCTLARENRRGRRIWRYKILQVHAWACRTVASPRGAEAMSQEVQRITARADLLSDQLEALSSQIQELLASFEEAQYLTTMPGIGWVTVTGLIAEIGPIDKYQHGRQLIKLAGINPSRRESGKMAGRTMMTRRGRAGLRSLVYMATVSSIQHNPRIKAHYDRLIQRPDRPMLKMQALGACMSKFLLYAFAVMKKREAFRIDHIWKEVRLAA